MSSANVSSGGSPPAQHTRRPRPGASHTRIATSQTPSALPQHGGWARCEDDAPIEAPAAVAPPPTQSLEEPRTGVVRRMNFRAGARPPASAREQAASRARDAASGDARPEGSASDWRCLEEWAQPAKERRARRNTKVTIVQLTRNGDLLRQNGPDAWLPEAGDFVQRMSSLLGQGLGFERCRSVCLKGPTSVLTVTEAGDTKVVAVSGPVRSMANVLRRAGLE